MSTCHYNYLGTAAHSPASIVTGAPIISSNPRPLQVNRIRLRVGPGYSQPLCKLYQTFTGWKSQSQWHGRWCKWIELNPLSLSPARQPHDDNQRNDWNNLEIFCWAAAWRGQETIQYLVMKFQNSQRHSDRLQTETCPSGPPAQCTGRRSRRQGAWHRGWRDQTTPRTPAAPSPRACQSKQRPQRSYWTRRSHSKTSRICWSKQVWSGSCEMSSLGQSLNMKYPPWFVVISIMTGIQDPGS